MSPRAVLTLDLGTTATKAALWIGDALIGPARAEITTVHPAPGRAEQDPESWWDTVVAACAALRTLAPDEYEAVGVVACSAARETFALFDAALTPLGSGILWSDLRATTELDDLGDATAFRRATGVVLTPGCAIAKMAWVARHEPDRFASARWLLAPRDLVLARLTGTVITDPSLASRTGWYSLDGDLLGDDTLRARLPAVVPSTSAIPVTASPWSEALALPAGTLVVPGAGDRACEALGTGARVGCPMVSWGTTANVSVPHPGPVIALPTVGQVSQTGDGGFLVEAGLAAAGSAFDWLATITGRPVTALWADAAMVAPGADGVRAFPWFAGARAPHWRADATATFTGLRPHHAPGELARAMVEGVASDVARALELVDPGGGEAVVTGGGAANPMWRAVVGAVTGRTVLVRTHLEAATVGARLLAAAAAGDASSLESLNPVAARETPDPGATAAYAALRPELDRLVEALLAGAPTEEAT